MQINAFKRTLDENAQLSSRSCCTNPVRNSESVCKRGSTSLSGRLCEEGAAMSETNSAARACSRSTSVIGPGVRAEALNRQTLTLGNGWSMCANSWSTLGGSVASQGYVAE